MTKFCLCSLLLLNFFEVQAQFSLGADLVGMGLTRSPQNEIELKPDSSLSTTRLVFSVNSNLTGAFKSKQWEFSLGLGHKNYFWKQKFEAPTSDVKTLVGSDSQSDSSYLLKKISYSARLITLPIGVKYLFESAPDNWVNPFVSLRLIPSFAYRRSANPVFFKQAFFFQAPFDAWAQEDPALVESVKAYFKPKVNPFLMDGIAEAGCRLWGRKRKYAIDISMGYLYGFIPLHEQMGSTKGLFGNVALRFFFKSKSAADGLI